MPDRTLGITTVTVSTELRDAIKEWRDQNDCHTMHEAVFDLYQEAIKQKSTDG